jgi:hypothetical protein
LLCLLSTFFYTSQEVMFVSSKSAILASPGPIVSTSSCTFQVSIPSQLVKTLFLLIFACLAIPQAFAACHAVGPTATGSGSGADWSDMMAAPKGTSWVRGDIYYLADGNYGNSLSIQTALSGTTTIELRKAQSYDNGSSCGTSIAAGWNTATMGSAQAYWASTGSGQIVQMGTSGGYFTFNGNGNVSSTEIGCGGVNASPPSTKTSAAPNPKACGIKIDDSTCTSTATDGCDGGSGVMKGGGPGIIWEDVEWFGQGLNANGNNNSETYFWFANGGTLTGLTVTHCYCHNASTTYLTVVSGGWNSGSFDHSYIWGVYDGSTNHGEAIQLQGNNSSSAVHHNLFRDQQTNGDVVGVATGTQTSFLIYDNADICSSGGTSTTCRHNDGWLGCFQSGNNCVATNWLVYNNTLSFPSSCGAVLQAGSGNVFNNNLYFNCGGASNGGGATITQDYNSYLNSGSGDGGAHSVAVTSGAPNPFVSSTSVQLTANSTNYNNRVSLGSSYDTFDLYGNAFTTDRGAAQFMSAATPGTPTNLSGIPH